MDNSFRKKYTDFENGELISILMSKVGDYQKEAIDSANEILKERGINVDLYKEFTKHFEAYLDEELISIVELNDEKHQEVAIKAIEDILRRRGYEIAIDENQEKKQESKLNFKPLVIAFVLLGINFFLSASMYQYEITGTAPAFLKEYLRSMGIFHDILFRAIIVGLIIYYRQKQNGKYLIAWIIAGLLLGAWVLVVVGIIELITEYPITKEDTTAEKK